MPPRPRRRWREEREEVAAAWNRARRRRARPLSPRRSPPPSPGPTGRGAPRRSRRRGRPARRRERPEQPVVERHAGQVVSAIRTPSEPAAQAEHDRVHGAQRRARLAAEATALAHAARQPQQREEGEDGEADHRAGEALAERRLRDVGREVDVRGVYSESSTRPLSRNVFSSRRPAFGSSTQKPSCARAGEHDLAAVRQLGEQLRPCDLRRRRDVELAADQERLDVRAPHAAYSFSSGSAGHASTSRPPAQMKSVPGLPRIEPRRARRREVTASRRAASARPIAASSPQTNAFGKTSRRASDWNQKPLASPFAADEPGADRHRRGQRRGLRGRLHQPVEGRDPHVAAS